MTSVQAKERIERHLLSKGYSRKDGQKHTYLLHPDGLRHPIYRVKHYPSGDMPGVSF